jgi:hypothetical protein
MKAEATIRNVENQEEILETVEVNIQFIDVPEQPGMQDVMVFYENNHHFLRFTPDMKHTTKYCVWPIHDNEHLLVVEMDQFVE